jgi:uncharacterized membrane protein
MTWLQRYRVRHYLRNSIWVWPVISIGVALVAARLLHWVEKSLGLEASINPETARSVLGALAGAMFTFIVFVCSSLLLVVQLASAQMSPRIIATMFRDRVTKFTLVVFVFTFTFALSAMIRIETSVPLLVTYLAAYGSAASIGVFLYLIDHVGKMLRPSGALYAVAAQAHRVIDEVYPRVLTDTPPPPSEPVRALDHDTVRTVPCPTDGVILAFDVQGLVVLGDRHDCVIEMIPQVGYFMATAYPLFRVYGGANLSDEALCQCVALGAERTMEQDPMLAFRLIVDIASKALSPAINDPTTAVMAIDRIQHLLRHVGSRRLDDERVRDSKGRVRLMYRTPDWPDFVALAVTEIRHFGASSIQVARRLRAMLEDLVEALPTERAERLRQELRLLKKSSERFFQEPEDRALADVSDAQGVGGTRGLAQFRPQTNNSLNDGKTQ